MFQANFIHKVFSKVAGKYDLMNDVMSLNLHKVWKRQFCDLVTKLDARILDSAAGSGDIAFELYNRAKKANLTPNLVLSDVNASMLALAKDRAVNSNILHNIDFVEADATQMPWSDQEFDYYTISFGIRNVPDIQKALNESYRLLKPGGKFLCLEFSKPTAAVIRHLYGWYLDKVIPKLGGAIAQDEQSYQYLVDSIKAFPDQNIFISMMQRAGFKMCYFKNLSFSIASIYIGYKD